ncbi:MAG: SpoIIE family protein phosphatase [Candidatus Latescibacteria bacterium]|nr:SpoIIE family protein phosphatase [bacterium]MBD3423570.1 SpoIIE family protein phosphatase [Candidatus Latescibacterota bacterium]
MNPDSLITFTRVDTLDFTSPPFPKKNDYIVSLRDSSATIHLLIDELSSHPPGHTIPFRYSEGTDTLSSEMVTRPVENSEFLSVMALQIMRTLIGLSFIAVGLWAHTRRSESGAIWILAMFCFSMASFMIAGVALGLSTGTAFNIPFLDQILTVLRFFVAFVGAFWLNLQFLFPRPREFIRKHPAAGYSLCYAPVVIVTIAGLFHHPLFIMLPFIIGIQTAAGFVMLGWYSGRTDDNLEKRQTRLVLWGTGIGSLGLLLLIVVFSLFRSWFAARSAYIIYGLVMAVFAALLLSPVSFAYAFGRYRLLEVEAKIKRGTRYTAVTVILLLLFFGLIYLITHTLINRSGLNTTLVIPAVVLAVAVIFAPVQRRIRYLVEKKIYPERDRMKEMLKNFLSKALLTPERSAFWTGLEKRFKEALNVNQVYPILNAGPEIGMIHWQGEDSPFNPEGEFCRALYRLKTRPLMMDEVYASEIINLSPEEKKWLLDKEIAIVLPLVSHDRMIGFLAFGYKSGEKDFESADLELLSSLALQAAIASENIILLAENIEKERMEKELNIARQVQEGLLPRTIPDTPGLEVAGKSESCLEIAGDYYDVIRLDQSRTVLAIGDVSGKGAGAALLMSNLQASIRTAVRIGSDLREIVNQINDLIYENTQVHQFITFFVGIYDRSSSTFSYVNAGHNPPLVVTAEGKMYRLEKGGLILGAMPQIDYELDRVGMSGGELLFFYTDGLTEAVDAAEEMYDEKRVINFIINNRELKTRELLEKIEAELKKFTGEIEMGDDLTMLAARVLQTHSD